MKPQKTAYLLLAGVSLLVAAALGWQWRVGGRLRAELDRQRAAVAEHRRLQAEHARLAALQVTPEERSRRQDERERLTVLLTEVEGMRRRADLAANAARRTASPLPPLADIRERAVPAVQWRNAGQAEPVATIETALWAAAGGDLDVLAGAMQLDEGSRQKAAEFFARQPAALQREVGTPEKLIALLAAKDVPLGTAQVLTELPGPEQTKLTVRTEDVGGNAKTLVLRLKNDGKNWRVVVPARTVDEYVNPTAPDAVRLKPAAVVAPAAATP